VSHPRPRYDIADIVRAHRHGLEVRQFLSRGQKRVLTAISRCRTAALGGHVEVCTGCGREHPVYNSCRNRHCPKCQAAAQQKWIDARSERILNVPHFHVVFTPPSELRPLAKRHPAEVYAALFRATSELLLELGRTRMKAALGLTLVLHTWTRDLRFHPHVHVLATAGGLSLDGKRFVHSRKDYLFPVEVMGRLLRGKVLDALRVLNRKGAFPEIGKRSFGRLMASLAAHTCWVVYAKAPFRHSQHVLSYLGRYTHRVGLANSRLLDVGPGHVTFRTKGKGTATLHPVDFLARFIQHVLPDGFHKIRHAGLYASPFLLERARALLPNRPTTKTPESSTHDEPIRCPHCGALIQRIRLARAPPLEGPCV
jgi:predicted RNA-binding Zn-ribbon protein involved in translation (DUF1610 family)